MDPSTVPGAVTRDVVERTCDAEVGEPNPSVPPEQDVGRLDVTVDEPPAVGRSERACGCRGDVDGLTRWHHAPRSQDVRDARSIDELHDDEPFVVLDPGVEHRGDIRVRDARRVPGLHLEACDEVGVLGELRPQDLHGDVTTEAHVMRAPDRRHAAGADLLEQAIAVGQQRAGCCHPTSEPNRRA